MTATVKPVEGLSRIHDREEAARIATACYDALLALLESLDPEDWQQRTVCSAWDVADMVRHLLGAAKANASRREAVRQFVHGQRHRAAHDGNDLDAMNALQVADHRDLGPGELVAQLRRTAPDAVRTRMRFPRLLGGVPIPLSPAGDAPAGSPTRITVRQLYLVTYTRDVWLHRTDIARATGRELSLDPAVDGRLVEDVVAEWGDRHGRPFELVLTGPAGGTFRAGAGSPRTAPCIELDAVDFCWILSGRAEPPTDVPGHDLLTQRLVF